MAFRFRQFIVEDDHSTMRVGTDAMLLGAWADPGNARHILDLGTGCGVLALMMAQKSTAIVKAVDQDAESVTQAGSNFRTSPWCDRLTAICTTAESYAEDNEGGFDFIISNPPFFTDSLKSPSAKRNMARHADASSRTTLLSSITRLLKADGRLAMVLPAEGFGDFMRLSCTAGFHPTRVRKVRSSREKEPVRVLGTFRKSAGIVREEEDLIIFEAPGKFTREYLEITSAFHRF